MIKTVSGAYKGSLSTLRAHEIGSMVIREALIRAKVQPEEVSEVIMGQVQLFLLSFFPRMQGGYGLESSYQPRNKTRGGVL
jgi:acetyl-CoA acetyltransferase